MSRMDSFERNEKKYLIDAEQKRSFLNQIQEYIKPDRFHRYRICNVYMDTPDFRLIRNSMERPSYKEKLRIRSYGPVSADGKVFVELKKKYLGTVYKRRTVMAPCEADAFVLKKDSCSDISGQVEREIRYFIDFYENLIPAMYIGYRREAWQEVPDNSIRITFDDDIFWRTSDISLESESLFGTRILSGDDSLMEIKCGAAMPLWLSAALAENKIYKTSFSKYGQAYSRLVSVSERRMAG